MSLKAKLEAVIYAAEEPVTLAQFASLFAEEALAYRAEEIAHQEELQRKLAKPEEYESANYGPADGLIKSAPELAELLGVVTEMREPLAAGSDSYIEGGDVAAPEPESEAALIASPDESVPEPSLEPDAESELDSALAARRMELKRNREVREILRGVLDELIADYSSDGRGLEIREIAGGFRMGTKPEMHDAVRSFVKSLKPPLKLSLPALETLAVIAYKQPVTAPEVGEIRGVDSAGVLGSLMSRKLITTAGRKQVIGRPMLYKTTKEFLLRFGLKDVNELPSMEEFEKIAALELSETDEAELAGESYAETAESGELFQQDIAGKDSQEAESSNQATESETQTATAVSTPTAEPSQEAAEAYAPVDSVWER